MPPLDILYEDNHLLVVNKPAGLVTQGASADEPSLVSRAKDYIREKYHKPGNIYLGIVSRLDALVSGAIVVARTSKSAARLTEQFRSRDVEKIYWAVVEGAPRPATGSLRHWLAKDDAAHRVVVLPDGDPLGQEARLAYQTLQTLGQDSLLEITLETGRKHQIRVQLAAAGVPILGDRKYGSTRSFAAGIALHSRRLSFSHPTKNERLSFTVPPPPAWNRLKLDRQ